MMYYNQLKTSLNGYFTTQTYISSDVLSNMRTKPTTKGAGSFWLYYWGGTNKYNFSGVGTTLTKYNEITLLLAPTSTVQNCTLIFDEDSYIELDAEIYA